VAKFLYAIYEYSILYLMQRKHCNWSCGNLFSLIRLSFEEPKTGNDCRTKKEGEQFPVAVAWDWKLLCDDLSASDVNEGTSCDTWENDCVNVTSIWYCHANCDTKGCGEREYKDELAAKFKVIGERLHKRNTEGWWICTLVDENGNSHVDDVTKIWCET